MLETPKTGFVASRSNYNVLVKFFYLFDFTVFISTTVHTSFSPFLPDSEAERITIQEKVYPELKELCALHNRDLQFIDPHLGLKDAHCDDHSIPDVCLSTLRRCMGDNLQSLNMMVSFTELPTTKLIIHSGRIQRGFRGLEPPPAPRL